MTREDVLHHRVPGSGRRSSIGSGAEPRAGLEQEAERLAAFRGQAFDGFSEE